MAHGVMETTAVHVKAVIFDLDGVIYRGKTAIPGGSDTLSQLRDQGRQAYFFTNNSTRSRESYVELLAGFGIESDPEHIVTSASLTAEYLQSKYRRATVLVVGEAGLVEELRRVGVRVVRRRGERTLDAVVVGMDRKITYAKIREAQQALLTGAEFIATNRDATYPIEGGLIPGAGSVVAAIATAAEREPITMGKPSEWSGKLIARHAGVEPWEALMVGDRIETDIVMGRRAGLWTCMVLTGISSFGEAGARPEEERPHWVIPSIAELPELLCGLTAGTPPFDWREGSQKSKVKSQKERPTAPAGECG